MLYSVASSPINICRIAWVFLAPVLALVELITFSSGATAEQLQLEEVLVTARKRSESIVETPASVSAFSAADLARAGITNIQDLERIVPGLDLGGQGSDRAVSPYIRGNGQREISSTLDPSVAVYINGVVQGRNIGTMLDILDLESVQVLRGPHGTLFGKNVTGGAILMTTRKPGENFGGKINARVGNYNRRDFSATVDVPLVPNTLFSSFSVASINADGWQTNQLDDSAWQNDKRLAGIMQLRWLASETLTADVFVSYARARQRQKGQQCIYVLDELGFNPPEPILGLTALGIDSRATCESQGPQGGLATDRFFSEQGTTVNQLVGDKGAINLANPAGVNYDTDSLVAALTLDWQLGAVGVLEDFSIKSISGYLRTNARLSGDFDGTGLNLVGRYNPDWYPNDQFSQELQFNGTAHNGSIRFTSGLFWYLETTSDELKRQYSFGPYDATSAFDSPSILVNTNESVVNTKNQSAAVFGQLSFDLSDYIELTAGARWTWENRWTRNDNFLVDPDSMNGNPNSHFVSSVRNSLFQYDGPIQALPITQWSYEFDARAEDDDTTVKWTPMLSLRLTAPESMLNSLGFDNAMSYISYSTGFRSGGVQPTVRTRVDGEPIPDSFDPETNDTLELGIKLEALNGKLITSMAYFYSNYRDMQVTNVATNDELSITPFIDNVGRAIIQGVETELVAIPHPDILFHSTISYMTDDIVDWESSEFVNNEQQIVDRSDEKLVNIPRWKISVSTDYYYRTRYGVFIPSLELQYATEIYRHFDRTSWLSQAWVSQERTFVNARFSWEMPGNRSTLTLWGRNLNGANDDYIIGGVPLASNFGLGSLAYAPPRTYGLDFSYRFGSP